MSTGPWDYDAWPSGEPYDWGQAARGSKRWDQYDFHVDLGCGRLKKGRIGVDRYDNPGVDYVMDLNARDLSLPFKDGQIHSIISHHCMEHIGEGFIHLMEECWRVLEPGGLLRIIVPLFPSRSAVEDPDHCRYFMTNSFAAFCGKPGQPHWHESFATPYTTARFTQVDQDYTGDLPGVEPWSEDDMKELRVALLAEKA